MPIKKQKIDKENLVRVAMSLAEQQGWDVIGMSDIAEEAGMPLVDFQEIFEDKTDILMALGKIIDARVLRNIGEVDEDLSEQDRLFDILMERFDVLSEYHGGVSSVLKSFCFDPAQVVISMPHLARSMALMLEASGVETTGVSGAVRVAGLTGVYIKTLKVWLDDDSEDMAKVMAALDKDLGRAQSFVDMFSL